MLQNCLHMCDKNVFFPDKRSHNTTKKPFLGHFQTCSRPFSENFI